MPVPSSDRRPAAPAPSRIAGERRNVRGVATRLRILATAERLFAERGISSVPLRDIGAEAGQRNHAAVQYHFGDREEIVRAIMEYRGQESENDRTARVAQLMLAETKPSIQDVVGAFVHPLAIHFESDNHYLPFLSAYITEEGGYDGLVGVHTGASVIALQALLPSLVPGVAAAILEERWWVMLTSTVHALARYQTAQRKRQRLPADIEVLVTDLITTLSAGLAAAPAPGDPRSA